MSENPYDEIKRLLTRNKGLRQQLNETRSDLGAALGIALVALADPELAIRQLEEMAETDRRRTEEDGDNVREPHWRTTVALLAAKTKKTTTGPAPDVTDGGAR